MTTLRHNIPRQKQKAITLLELLITLSLLTILASLSSNLYSSLAEKNQQRITIQTIEAAFKRIKTFSSTNQKTVVLCGTYNKIDCIKDWTGGFMSFVDNNKNGKRDPNDNLIEHHQPLTLSHGNKVFACYRRYFRTRTNGPLASMPDSIAYLPTPSYHHLTRRIIVSRLGRTKVTISKWSSPCKAS